MGKKQETLGDRITLRNCATKTKQLKYISRLLTQGSTLVSPVRWNLNIGIGFGKTPIFFTLVKGFPIYANENTKNLLLKVL